jgi:Ser/Thr protein kinase RdoA (MazF antagonist)
MIDAVVHDTLHLWDVPANAKATRINVSENVTYRIDSGADLSVLRVHRPGYHSRRAIECELAWIDALRGDATVQTAAMRMGRDGAVIQSAAFPDRTERYMVMFDFIEGTAPSEDGDLSNGFAELGALAAKTHLHSIGWNRPSPFERLTWDLDTVFGKDAHWGNWRDAPNVTPTISAVLEKVEARVRTRLNRFGKSADRYGLIHADMRLANLIQTPHGTALIDFDDSGFGWHLYDFAAAISFIEDNPQIPALKQAWLSGYRSVRDLPEDQSAELDTFIMLRRMALLAWIGSHINAPEPQALAPDFACVSAELGRAYLQEFA